MDWSTVEHLRTSEAITLSVPGQAEFKGVALTAHPKRPVAEVAAAEPEPEPETPE